MSAYLDEAETLSNPGVQDTFVFEAFDAHTAVEEWVEVSPSSGADWVISHRREELEARLRQFEATVRTLLQSKQSLETPNIPPNFGEIEKSVKESRHLLDWEGDWAGEDNPRFQEATWKRAADFVLQNTKRLWQISKREAPSPDILPVGDSSIDIEWEHEGRNLLVNIPAEPEKAATFFGRDRTRQYPIKGEIDTSANNEWLLTWLWA